MRYAFAACDINDLQSRLETKSSSLNANTEVRVADEVLVIADIICGWYISVNCVEKSFYCIVFDWMWFEGSLSPAPSGLHMSLILKQFVPLGFTPPEHPSGSGPPRIPGSFPPLTQSKP